MVDIATPKKRGRPPKSPGPTPPESASKSFIAEPPKKRGRPKKPQTDGSPAKTQGPARPRGRPRKDPVPKPDKPAKAPPGKRGPYQKKIKQVGRPRKHPVSDEDNKEEKERRPVGRPPTGAVKWNIVRTGRKVGRPKATEYNEDGTRKKRGRQSKKEKENEVDNIVEIAIEENVDDNEEEQNESENETATEKPREYTVTLSTPKKRGRPSKNFNSSIKSIKRI